MQGNVILRSNFSSTRLVHLLGDIAGAGALAEPPAVDVAERLGQWLGAFDAMTLHAVHESFKASVAPRTPSAPGALQGLQAQLREVQAELVQAFDAPAEPSPGWNPQRQRYLELQRLMESRIAPLRSQVRQALARASQPLRQLAALDAVWEQMLAAREQRLLQGVPAFLEQRFATLRAAAHAAPDGSEAWQEQFGAQMQEVLRAELELRLQPVIGQREALERELGKMDR